MSRPMASLPPFPIRRKGRGLLPLALMASGTLLLGGGPALRAQGQAPSPPMRGGQPSAARAEEAARQAAERILTAVRSGDARAYYQLLAPAPQRVSSPALVAKSFRTLPKLLSWQIGEVEPGIDSSSLSVQLLTSAGPREVLLIIDGNGRMERFTINARDEAAEDVVRQFMAALSEGRYVSANSFLSARLQEEISQPVLQRKWLNLQSLTGNFKRVQKIWKAESDTNMKLVIVTTEFNRLTDNLFVLLNSQNQIIGVDFPTDPNPPSDPTP